MPGPTHRDPLTGLMLAGALVALGFGLAMPAITIEQFVVFDRTKSIAGAIGSLFAEGHALLGAVVALFSIGLPVAKLLLSFRIWLARDAATPAVRRAVRWTVLLGKWSMLDVFMAAMVVAVLTLDVIASVEAHAGLYVFGGAIVLAMLAAHRLEARVMGKPEG